MPKIDYYKVFHEITRQMIGNAMFKEIELKAIKRSGGLNRWSNIQKDESLPLLAFVGMGPSKLDAIRKTELTGPVGRVFVKKYLEPMDLTREQVIVTNIFKEELEEEPTPDEIEKAVADLKSELYDKRPDLIIALGQSTKRLLGNYVDFVLPHPNVITKFGSKGEIDRKLKQITKAVEEEDFHHYDEDQDIKIFKVCKSDLEKKLVYGVILEPDTVDAQNDIVSPEEIENAAHDYLVKSRIIGRQHKAKANVDLVESYISPVDFKINEDVVKKGSWVGVVKVLDDKLWQDVKDKKVTGFSIGGLAERKPIGGETD